MSSYHLATQRAAYHRQLHHHVTQRADCDFQARLAPFRVTRLEHRHQHVSNVEEEWIYHLRWPSAHAHNVHNQRCIGILVRPMRRCSYLWRGVDEPDKRHDGVAVVACFRVFADGLSFNDTDELTRYLLADTDEGILRCSSHGVTRRDNAGALHHAEHQQLLNEALDVRDVRTPQVESLSQELHKNNPPKAFRRETLVHYCVNIALTSAPNTRNTSRLQFKNLRKYPTMDSAI